MSEDYPEFEVSSLEFCSVAVVASQYNSTLVDGLIGAVCTTLAGDDGDRGDVEVFRVPGAMEIPQAIEFLVETRPTDFDAVIALGVVIAGDTDHHEIIGYSTANALHRIAGEQDIPVINGIIVCHNAEQAHQRCLGDLARGAEFARAALAMIELRHEIYDSAPLLDDEEEPGGGDLPFEVLDDEDDRN